LIIGIGKVFADLSSRYATIDQAHGVFASAASG
jgi:hypothetical protein